MEDEKYRIQRSKAIENANIFNPTIYNEDAEAETMYDGSGGGECIEKKRVEKVTV